MSSKCLLLLKWILFISHMGYTNAWWDQGHALVGKIAIMNLPNDIISKIEALGQINVPFYYPNGNLPLGSVWPDTLRAEGLSSFDHWHSEDIPYVFPGNFSYKRRFHDDSLEVALGRVQRTLISKTTITPWAKAFALRFIFHLYGDLHQPLHCGEVYNQTFPSGSFGGNLIQVTYPKATTVENLHSFFDSVGGLYTDYMPDPMNDDFLNSLNQDAQKIINNYPRNSYPWLDQEPISIRKWLNEGFNASFEYGYNLIANGSVISDDVAKLVQTRLLERIALAGYRLANALKQFNYDINGRYPQLSIVASENPNIWRGRETGLLICFIFSVLIGWPLLYYLGFKRNQNHVEINNLKKYTPV